MVPEGGEHSCVLRSHCFGGPFMGWYVCLVGLLQGGEKIRNGEVLL